MAEDIAIFRFLIARASLKVRYFMLLSLPFSITNILYSNVVYRFHTSHIKSYIFFIAEYDNP